MTRGAVILCGGRSTRMGRDKATLPFGDATLLERVVAILQPLVDEVTVVTDQHHCSRIVGEKFLQQVQRFKIQIIRRLIKNQQVGWRA